MCGFNYFISIPPVSLLFVHKKNVKDYNTSKQFYALAIQVVHRKLFEQCIVVVSLKLFPMKFIKKKNLTFITKKI